MVLPPGQLNRMIFLESLPVQSDSFVTQLYNRFCRAAYAVVRSIRPSVRPSVTFVYSINTSNYILKLILFYDPIATTFWFFYSKTYGNIPIRTP